VQHSYSIAGPFHEFSRLRSHPAPTTLKGGRCPQGLSRTSVIREPLSGGADYLGLWKGAAWRSKNSFFTPLGNIARKCWIPTFPHPQRAAVNSTSTLAFVQDGGQFKAETARCPENKVRLLRAWTFESVESKRRLPSHIDCFQFSSV
jgi:hypothetical protein